MAVTASIFLSPILKCVIEVFSLYNTERIYTKKLYFTEQQIGFFSLLQ